MSQLFLLFAATAPLAVAAALFARAALRESRQTQTALFSDRKFGSTNVPIRHRGNNRRQ